MAILRGRQVIFVGDEHQTISDINLMLTNNNVKTRVVTCTEMSEIDLANEQIDLIIMNYIGENSLCRNIFSKLKDITQKKSIPLFTLVEDSNKTIQDAITLGATDYITKNDDIGTIFSKINVLFDESKEFSGTSSSIDITPEKPNLTATGIKVYVVEDDPLLRNLLSIRFNKSSFPCEFSQDGNQVTDKMKAFDPDIIILDLMLPGISGFEILSLVKSEDSLKDKPVIVFSNRDSREDIEKAKKLGATAFYVKAMTDLSDLVKQIELLVKNKYA